MLFFFLLLSLVPYSHQQGNCRRFDVDFGRVTYTGITAIIACNDGFLLKGTGARTCVTGRWNLDRPTCDPYFCGVQIGDVTSRGLRIKSEIAGVNIGSPGVRAVRVGGTMIFECRNTRTTLTGNPNVYCAAPKKFELNSLSCGGDGGGGGGNWGEWERPRPGPGGGRGTWSGWRERSRSSESRERPGPGGGRGSWSSWNSWTGGPFRPGPGGGGNFRRRPGPTTWSRWTGPGTTWSSWNGRGPGGRGGGGFGGPDDCRRRDDDDVNDPQQDDDTKTDDDGKTDFGWGWGSRGRGGSSGRGPGGGWGGGGTVGRLPWCSWSRGSSWNSWNGRGGGSTGGGSSWTRGRGSGRFGRWRDGDDADAPLTDPVASSDD